MTRERLRVEVHPVTPDRWGDFAVLFARKGPRGGTPATAYCWCMAWRDRTHNPAANRDAMATIVRDGDVPGLLAYASGEPVGWISVAPREQHPQLLRSPTLKPADPDEPGVYSITCFAVYPTARRQGVRDALLAAAIEYARARGATALEAYPSTADYAHTDYMGPTELFLSHGFVLVRNAREHRVIMRLPISA